MLWRLKCFHFNYLRVSARGKGKFLRVESPIPYPRTAECPHTCPPWSSTTWRTRPWRLSRSSCCSGGKQSDSPNLKESEDRIFITTQSSEVQRMSILYAQATLIYNSKNFHKMRLILLQKKVYNSRAIRQQSKRRWTK